jgi:hypothetical protein
MVYSYSEKNGRKYPYYVCLNAQRKGWAVCPGKSLPVMALAIRFEGLLHANKVRD